MRYLKGSEVELIRTNCCRFLQESRGLPLLKNLPETYGPFKKVKVRKKNKVRDETLNELFDSALGIEIFRFTAFANGEKSFIPDPCLKPYYVFPENRFRFVYSHQVSSSERDYSALMEVLYKTMDENPAEDLAAELLRLTYSRDGLGDGISSGAEIVFHGLPFYYAVAKESIRNYASFVKEVLSE